MSVVCSSEKLSAQLSASVASKPSQIPLKSPPDNDVRKQRHSTAWPWIQWVFLWPACGEQWLHPSACSSMASEPGPVSTIPLVSIVLHKPCAEGWLLNTVTRNTIKMLEDVQMGSGQWRHVGRNVEFVGFPKEIVMASELWVLLP